MIFFKLQEKFGKFPWRTRCITPLFFLGQYFQAMNDNADPPIVQDGTMGPRFLFLFWD